MFPQLFLLVSNLSISDARNIVHSHLRQHIAKMLKASQAIFVGKW